MIDISQIRGVAYTIPKEVIRRMETLTGCLIIQNIESREEFLKIKIMLSKSKSIQSTKNYTISSLTIEQICQILNNNNNNNHSIQYDKLIKYLQDIIDSKNKRETSEVMFIGYNPEWK